MPQNYRGVESTCSLESKDLNSNHHVNNHHVDASSSKNLTTNITHGNCSNSEAKISTHHNHETIPNRVGKLIPYKKAKLNGDSCNGYSDVKNVDDKVDCLLTDPNRKMPHPMTPVDVNRVARTSNKLGGPVSINSSLYSYITDNKVNNPVAYNSESLYSTSHSMKSYQPSTHTNLSSSSGQENHSPSPPCPSEGCNTSSLRPMTNILPVFHNHGHNYRNGYIKPSTSPLLNTSRLDSITSSIPEINHSSSSTCDQLVTYSPHNQVPVNGTSIPYSSTSSSSSPCSSVDKILPIINVVNHESDTLYKEPASNGNQGEEIMIISNLVDDRSNSQIYSNCSKDIYQMPANSAELRRARFKETWDFLNKSDLIEVTLKTADLLKRNQMLQKDIDLLKEEVAKIIPNSRLCDGNKIDLNNVCIENSA